MVIELLTESQSGIFAGLCDQTRFFCVENGVAASKLSLTGIGKEHQKRSDQQDDPLCGLICKYRGNFF